MLEYGQAYYDLKACLRPLYDEREAEAIAHEVIGYLTGLDRTGRLMEKLRLFSEAQQEQYDGMVNRLVTGTPLQYVIQEAWFLGNRFYVDERVLIPRPETEELVLWVGECMKLISKPGDALKVLEIGTGSGCISISLKVRNPRAEVISCDISEGALAVARQNAESLGVDVRFVLLNFLDEMQRNKLGRFDVIVSNPPYIPETRREKLHTNVRDHEPGIALFVPGDDALLFYRAIADFGTTHMEPGGFICCEIEAGQSEACRQLFFDTGYKDVDLKMDIHGNWRMIRAAKKLPGGAA